MIEHKDLPIEFISIRQCWLNAINRVAEAIAYRYRTDTADQFTQKAGEQTVIESIFALNSLLVDYGEATVKSDVTKWYESNKDKIKVSGIGRMRFYVDWFEFMVLTLNRYGMLFESQPKGYSNVEMKSI